MPTITYNLHGQPSDSIVASNPSTSYSGRYQNTITNGNITNHYVIDRIEVHPVDGEYWENPVTKSVSAMGVPQWDIDVTDTVNLVVDVYYKNQCFINYLYNGGTASDVNILNPTTTINGGGQWLTYVQNISGSHPRSIKQVKIEVGGHDIAPQGQVFAGTTNGYSFILQVNPVLDDITVTIYIETNPTATYNLTGCTIPISSNTSPKWGYNPSTNANRTVTADSGYDLHDATVSVTMGGVDITSSVWTNPASGSQTALLNLPDLTGDLVVNISAVATGQRFITYNLNNVTSSNTSPSVDVGDSYATTLSVDSEYIFHSVNVAMGGVDVTETVYDSTTHTISIPSVTGNVVITASAYIRMCSITYELTNCTSTNSATEMGYGTIYQTLLQKSLGYAFTQVKVLRGGIDVTSLYYNDATNYISVPVTDDIVIIATATEGAISLNLYQNSSEFNRVDKTNYLVSVGTLAGVFKDVTSITTPSIIIERDSIDFNYIHIPALNRYYFVEEVISVKRRLWQIRLKVDVLMSFASKIREQKGYISRNENDYDEYLIDNQFPMENEPFIDVVDTTTIFSTSDVDTLLLNYYK